VSTELIPYPKPWHVDSAARDNIHLVAACLTIIPPIICFNKPPTNCITKSASYLFSSFLDRLYPLFAAEFLV
jgi:hypothetical protein